MKRLVAALTGIAAVLCLAGGAQADPSEYGIESASVGVSSTSAGAHPDFTLALQLNQDPKGQLPSTTKDLFFDLPPGLLGNPNAVPKCTAAQLVSTDPEDPSNKTGCPQVSQVGIAEVELFKEGNLLLVHEPIFNMQPGYGEPARFGFIADIIPVLVDTELRPDREYAATAKVEGSSSFIPLSSATSTFWGTPADESHDSERITAYEAVHNGGVPEAKEGKRSAGLPLVPYMLNPTRCGVPQGVNITAVPYALPELHSEFFAPLEPNTGCSSLSFKPDMSVIPTSSQAESGTGLDVNLTFPTDGFEQPDLAVGAELKRAEVTLPKGVTVNPSEAVGLDACSESSFKRETAFSQPNEGCPDASKIGSVVARSPLTEELAEGSLFLAKPNENPFHSLLAIYLVLKIPNQGVIVKLSGKVEPNEETGQLVTTFDDSPQLPVSYFHLSFRTGARSPLVTPPHCGTYISTATFTSWGEQTLTTHPAFEITSGIGGASCPQGTPPFTPGFEAGSINDNAGSFSPFYMRLTRHDGDQRLTRFSSKLPPGLLAKLAGVSECSDAAIAAAKGKTGIAELTAPSCPASSMIGHVMAGAGVGQILAYAEGTLYFAGPYKGAPLSVVAIVPAVTGPFDIGTVVTREALRVDPRTGEVEADGSSSDPIPRILAGIPLRVRDVRVHVDRPDFTLNPTSCDPLSVGATLWGGGDDISSAAEASPVSLGSRFQVANCSLLGFRPGLSLKLSGGTHRGAHPALRAVLRPRPGDANLGAAQVTLPRSAFIEQAHFRTICTRVQFAAEQCPAGSIYGHIRAFSPLLDEPLEGPVYLRSSTHQLPDLVFALRGIIDIDVVGRVDSVKGRLRSSFESIPDAPISKTVLTMQGGKKGLFVNSTSLCRGKHRATVRFTGQNGKVYDYKPVVDSSCGGKAKKHGKRGRGQRNHNS